MPRSHERSSLRFLCLFFFSSRRRHTRSLRDWSSDVCSSDLRPQQRQAPCTSSSEATRRIVGKSNPAPSPNVTWIFVILRSEERRVGKECRSRLVPDDLKKKTGGSADGYVIDEGQVATVQ